MSTAVAVPKAVVPRMYANLRENEVLLRMIPMITVFTHNARNNCIYACLRTELDLHIIRLPSHDSQVLREEEFDLRMIRKTSSFMHETCFMQSTQDTHETVICTEYLRFTQDLRMYELYLRRNTHF
jgi:hypothetical protein